LRQKRRRDFREFRSDLKNSGSERDGLVKTILVSVIALVALTTAVLAAPLLGSSSRLETPRPGAIPIAQATLPNSGKVTEVIPAGQYTYLHVTRDGEGTWLAIPLRDVPVGAHIQYGKGMVMKDFRSSSLDRTFETVLFLGGVQMAGESPAAAPAGHPPMPAAPAGHPPVPAAPAGHPPVPAAPAAQGGLPNGGQVNEVIPAGSYTYLHVTRDGTGTWLAIPRQDIPVGADIRYAQGMVMKKFHSGALDRTFDEVLFLGGVVVMGE
jgi:hypothetical protein